MAETHKASQETEEQWYAEAANAGSRLEFIGADELKARLATNDAEEEVEESNAQADAEEVVPRKKKKKKPKGKQPKPTGFEDYHADAPITPDEHAEEQELYDRFVDQASQ